jgi:hypothetical protein
MQSRRIRRFFNRIGFSEGTQAWISGNKADRLCEELREAVRRSEHLGYHRSAGAAELQRLVQLRMRAEPGFQPPAVIRDRLDRGEERRNSDGGYRDGGHRDGGYRDNRRR